MKYISPLFFFFKNNKFAVVATSISFLCYVLAMPNFDIFSLAWIWAIPFAFWAIHNPSWKSWLISSGIFSYFSGVFILIWLRHLYPPLGFVAVFLLPIAYSLFPFIWLIFLRIIFPNCSGRNRLFSCVFNLIGLAGLWVLLEWALSCFLTGFPWMPLSATQWKCPVMLSLCQFGGPTTTSFIIILFNLSVTRYAWRLIYENRNLNNEHFSLSLINSFKNICPEFYIALAPIIASFFVYIATGQDFWRNSMRYFSFATLQTDFNPMEKWNPQKANENIDVVSTLSVAAPFLTREKNKMTFSEAKEKFSEYKHTPPPSSYKNIGIDFLLLPEAVLPYTITAGKNNYVDYLENLSKSIKTPIILGTITEEKTNTYYNSIHIVSPQNGLDPNFYAKRHLVPFGEYVPFADILPLRKIVPVPTDCISGKISNPLTLKIKENEFRFGPLICYEDIFPNLALEQARNYIDSFLVVTNDAWYGKEAGAYQHAAHSVLHAVSFKTPVIRCGNAGWSGVINPMGHTEAMTNDSGSIYFRGIQRFEVVGFKERQFTFYAQYGNWFVALSGLLFISAYLRNRRWKHK